jgi:hypothetical protein
MSYAALAGILWMLAASSPVSALAAEGPWFDGRPDFAAGTDLAYFVWREGDQWHVRWTTRGATRHFSGSVSAEGGDLKGLERIDVEKESRIVAPGRPARVVRGPRGRRHVAPARGPVVATREEDKIEKENDRLIVWSSRTTADIDGFDFKVEDDVRVLRFLLTVDGQSKAGDVVIGRNNRHPGKNPFQVDLR